MTEPWNKSRKYAVAYFNENDKKIESIEDFIFSEKNINETEQILNDNIKQILNDNIYLNNLLKYELFRKDFKDYHPVCIGYLSELCDFLSRTDKKQEQIYATNDVLKTEKTDKQKKREQRQNNKDQEQKKLEDIKFWINKKLNNKQQINKS